MKAYIKVLAIFLLNFILSQSTIAQNSSEVFSSVRNHLDSMFEDLDKTKISTGFLEDYAIDLVDLHQYNGSDDPNGICVTRPIFDDIVRSISSASVVLHPIKANCNYILDEFGALISDQTVNLKYALFRYNFIAEDALTSNKIEYDETQNKVYNVYRDGAFVNPYEEAVLFAFSPSAIACTNTAVKYKLNIPQALRNLPVHAAWFDADDGNGYRQINPTNATIMINYPSAGEKILKLKVSTTVNGAGRIFTSRALIKICDSIEVNQLNAPIPNPIIDEQFSKNGVTATVTGFSSTGGSVRKPIIVVEGFDPWQLRELMTLFDDTADSNNNGSLDNYYGFTNYQTFYYTAQTYFLSKGYDYIYVDWHDSLADITKNGELLIDIINHINSIKASYGSTESNIVIGQSMGGLITRYALKTMENNEDDHQVSTFVSHDVPHLGANVPMGAQYFIYQLFKFAHERNNLFNTIDTIYDNKLTTLEDTINSIIHSEAAKQMMYHYVDKNGVATSEHHDQWQTNLNNLGFPQGDKGNPIENIAIVNGRTHGNTDYLINGQHLLKFEAHASTSILSDFLCNLIPRLAGPIYPIVALNSLNIPELIAAFYLPGNSTINAYAEINPTLSTNNTTPLSIIDINFTKKLLWLFNIQFNIFNSYCYNTLNDLYFDEYPGSIYNLSNLPISLSGSGSDSNILGEYCFDYGITNEITFIPVASALAIKGGEQLTKNDYKRDYYTNYPTPLVETPFAAYYLPNQEITEFEHINIDPSMFDWMLYQINMNIEGPNHIEKEGVYTVSNYNGPITWVTSDESIATIDSYGKLVAHNFGVVKISAYNYEDGKMYYKTKDVAIDYPNFVIDKQFLTNGNGYRFTAIPVNSDNTQLLNDLIETDILQYEWSILDDKGNLLTETTANNFMTFLPTEDEYVTVAVRLVDIYGNKSNTISLHTNLVAPFEINYKYVIIDKNLRVYFVKNNNTYEGGLPSQDFSVTFRYITLNNNDNSNSLISKYLGNGNCQLRCHKEYVTLIFEGLRTNNMLEWRYDFFDHEAFLVPLNVALEDAEGLYIRTITKFDLTIANARGNDLQRIPFAIIYDPLFIAR